MVPSDTRGRSGHTDTHSPTRAHTHQTHLYLWWVASVPSPPGSSSEGV